jgi:Family of unknown function (DUF6519)
MSFDLSRVTFDPWKDFSSVVMEQGRVQLDSDWNEWLAELTRRIRAGTLDTLGRAVYPATTPNAFLITPTAGSVSIGVGRMYVDGLLVENHGLPAPASGGWIPPNVTPPAAQPAWDPALDELVGQNPLDYLQQPYFPGVAVQAPFPTAGGPFLVYLDVWRREVTFLEYPDLVEKAVGLDTTGRLQTVWQVRLVDISSSGNVTCETKDADISAWANIIQPSAGRLTTGVVPSSPSGPCCLAPNTGFTGIENQLYRVEIHQGGVASTAPAGTASSQLPAGTATFKWSRNNASVATAVTGISQGATVLSVQSTGKDDVLRFSANDWVEITDDWLELNGQHGELHQVDIVTDSANTIKLRTAVTAASFPVGANGLTDPKRHTRLIKWDQKGKVYESDGTSVWTDLDAAGSSGDIPVPPPGTALILENGATVSFDLNPGTGSFKVGDYWNFAARTVDGTIENLIEAPPRGIHHHYARLAILTLGSTTPPPDCRVEWPPTTGGCDCASCVTAASHNGNIWTIQQAIDAVLAEGGGKVCLGPGVYNIATPITIGDPNTPAQNLALSGHGLPTLAPTAQFEGSSIMLIQNALDINVDYLVFSSGSLGAAGAAGTTGGLTIEGSSYVRVERCVFGLSTDTAQLSPAIAFGGPLLVACTLRENVFINVRLGVALASSEALLLTQIKMEDNQMFASDGAVFLGNTETLIASEIRFAKNFVLGGSGFILRGRGLDVAIEDNTFAIVSAPAAANTPHHAAVVCNISQTRVADNEITLSAARLTVDTSANPSGGLTVGSYTWVVTALAAQNRERVLTFFVTVNVSSQSNATLSWSGLPGATAYNIYRTAVNGATLLLDGSVPQSSSATVSYNDTVADGNLQPQELPAMQNDGIVIGAAATNSVIFKTQVTGNRITDLTGTGILGLSNAALSETLIARNQLSNLGGKGISLGGHASDTEIIGNSLFFVGQLAVSVDLAAIDLAVALRANVSENRVENLGPPPPTLAPGVSFAISLVGSFRARIAGNRIANIGLSSAISGGIRAEVFGLLDVADNDVQRGILAGLAGKSFGQIFALPAQPQANLWLALGAIGFTVSVEGNLLESFFGQKAMPSTVAILTFLSCTFSNNQCYLDSPDLLASVVSIESGESIIVMGNLVKGPNFSEDKNSSPRSMKLSGITALNNTPVVTVIGNITSMGIDVPPAGMPAAMVPLNLKL